MGITFWRGGFPYHNEMEFPFWYPFIAYSYKTKKNIESCVLSPIKMTFPILKKKLQSQAIWLKFSCEISSNGLLSTV